MKKDLKDYLIKDSSKNYLEKPLVFNLKKAEDRVGLLTLFKKQKIQEVIDTFKEQEDELLEVKDPKKILNKNVSNKKERNTSDERKGVWVYYPWSKKLIHILSPGEYEKLRTSRNHNLITTEEQKKLEKAVVSFAGLNVGNPGAVCCAQTGFNNFKLADFDKLSVSNLNRFRAGLSDLEINKAILTARQIYEINPFAKIKLFENGVIEKEEEKFLLNPKTDVLVEETDNLKLKITLREVARKNKVPVVMVTGNGPNLILDVERFDKYSNLPILNGHIKESLIDRIKNPRPEKESLREKILLARDFMGAKNLTPRLQKSFLEVGSKLAGIPQLGETSFLRGAVLGYVVRQIVTGKRFDSKRYYVNLEDLK